MIHSRHGVRAAFDSLLVGCSVNAPNSSQWICAILFVEVDDKYNKDISLEVMRVARKNHKYYITIWNFRKCQTFILLTDFLAEP
jgi:hypothetical protein